VLTKEATKKGLKSFAGGEEGQDDYVWAAAIFATHRKGTGGTNKVTNVCIPLVAWILEVTTGQSNGRVSGRQCTTAGALLFDPS
jgi:hypothetical protein